MNPFIRCFSFFLAVAGVSVVASASGTYTFKGVDVTPLVEFYAKDVKTLSAPVMMYNWSSGGNHPFWQQERSQTDPVLRQHAQNMAEVFWDRYGASSGGNMYGYGLYGAVDPVVTWGYGGGIASGANASWLVLELQLPAGFRMARASYDNRKPSAADTVVAGLLKKFDCPADTSIDRFLSHGGVELSASCKELAKAVLRDFLKIDGFSYQYSGTTFKVCDNSWQNQVAFVITNSNWIKSEHVKFFTSRSTQDVETRTRIQTLFLMQGDEQNDPTNQVKSDLIAYLKRNERSYVKGSTTVCAGDKCIITVEFCDEKLTCEKVDLRPLPRPGGPLITSAAAIKSAAYGLLWPDLDQKPKSSTIKTWLKENKFACSGVLPFEQKN